MSFEARIPGNVFCLPGDLVAFTAGADITKGQLVKITGAMTVSPATGATDAVIGVAVTSAKAGGKVTVAMGCPVVYVTAGGAVAVGSVVCSDAQGRTVATTTSGDRVLGIALEPASAAGDVILVAVNPQVY
jgi:predicted RecA/RadA family phage recombinase